MCVCVGGGGGGGGGGQRVCWPHPLKLLGGLAPPPGPPLPTPMILIRIIGGAWPPPLAPSSYAYDLNPKKKKVFVCVWGGGGGGGGEVLEIKLFFRRGGSGSAA